MIFLAAAMISQHGEALGQIGSLVVIRPPSPAPPRFFDGKKLKQPNSPMLPTFFPWYCEPIDWAASSMTGTPWPRAIAVIASMSAGSPKRWTGMIARVLLVMADSNCLASRLLVSRIDIHKYGLGLEAGNASGSGDKGKGLV